MDNPLQQFLQPPKSVLDYQNEYAQADALKTKNALQNLALQQQQAATAQSLGERNALQRIAAQSGGDRTALISGLRNSGLPGLMTQADSLEKSGADLQTAQSTAAKNTADAAKTNQGVQQTNYTQAMQKVLAFQSPADATASLNAAVASGKIDMQHATMMARSIPQNDPAAFDAWKRQWAIGIADPEKMAELMKPHIQTTNTGGQQVTQAIDPVTLKPTTVSSLANTQSPDNAANNATSISNNRANIAKDYAIAGLDASGNPANGTGLLDAPTIANAAARYNTDGTLPPNLGRGQQGPREIASILKEAAVQAAARGDTPEAQRVAQLANKANSAALNKLQTQQTMVGAFEKNFTKNADMAEQLSAAVDRTGVPIVNKWVNAGKRAVTGDPDLSAFDASVKAAVNEYAKIVSGATGSAGAAQGEISKIEGLLNSAQTPDQVKSVLSLMRKETQNRMAAFDEEKSQLTSSMTMPKSRTPAAASAGVPPDIAAILARHGGK